MQKVCIITLGCKVNKYESECMASSLIENGYSVTFELEPADIYIINSCAVTQMSEKKSRQYLAKIKKINADAKIIVCGCASENNAGQFKKEDLDVVVFGTQQKSNIVNYITNKSFSEHDFTCEYENMNYPYITSTRAYLKIQDGCNNFCSYCLIPYVRGRSRSRDLNAIIDEAQKLSNEFKEIVLIGIDISDYKINGKLALGEVLKNLNNLPARIRISSFEVRIIDDEFLTILKNMNNFAPSFHLSLQSGDNGVLKAMNRKYTREQYIEKCELIRKYFPDANITTDIIVGFPGETEDQFNNTVELAKTVHFGKIHVFPYSSRSGTVASRMIDLPSEIKKDRVKKLSAIGDLLSKEFNSRFIGSIQDVLLEDVENEYFVGFTNNYIKVYIQNNTKLRSGDMVKIKLLSIYKEGCLGEINE